MMNSKTWNPWTLTAIGMALALATASIVGIVAAGGPGAASETVAPAVHGVALTSYPMSITQLPPAPAPAVIAECRRSAANRTEQHDATIDTVTDVAHARAYGKAYSSCMSSRGYN